MKEIVGIEKAKQILGNFQFSEFSVVRELRYYEVPVDSSWIQMLDLVIESTGRTPNYRMKLVFSKVCALRLEGFGGGQFRITGLGISEVSGRQWEEINWEVYDYEANAVQFYSSSASIEQIDPIRT